MDWRNIPSLSALRAFEATARLTSVTEAARDLNVTHAAISQHIRTLEAHFNTPLMIRQGRKIDLTEAGRRFATSLAEGFGQIAEGVADLQNHLIEQPLKISLTPSFAENWLMARLGGFWADRPEIELALLPSHQLVDLRRDGIDVAIRYGNGHWPDYDVKHLVSARFMAVAAPGVVKEPSASPNALAKYPWFLDLTLNERHQWVRSRNLIDDNTPITDFATNELVLSAVRAGYGIAVQSLALIEKDIAAGTLEVLFDDNTDDTGYFIVTAKGSTNPKVAAFVDWLTCCG